jgi:hypothetical protein
MSHSTVVPMDVEAVDNQHRAQVRPVNKTAPSRPSMTGLAGQLGRLAGPGIAMGVALEVLGWASIVATLGSVATILVRRLATRRGFETGALQHLATAWLPAVAAGGPAMLALLIVH